MNNNDILNGEHPYLNTSQDLDLQKVANVLKNSDENCCCIRLWHPKLVARSYGKEKRLFCPPPIISLMGNGWNSNRIEMRTNLSTYREQLQNTLWHAEADGAPAEETKRLKTLLNKVPDLPLNLTLKVGINDGTTPFVASLEKETMVKCLFISSVDRRRYFKLSCEFTQYLGPSTIYPTRFIGKFESSEIRVVSKPPKKHTVRAYDSAYISLKSGNQVALFIRTRSQAVSTRFLCVDDPILVASSDHWSSFYIYAVDTDENADSEKTFAIRQGFICYNHVVRLVDALTGISTPNLILRKVDKNFIQVAPQSKNESVAMMQRVSFQFCDTASSYFGICGNSVIQQTAEIIGHEAHGSTDAIAWYITNSEYIEYKYFEAMGPTLEPIAPVPFIKTAQLEGVQENNTVIELYGINLGQHLSVYFGLSLSHVTFVNSSYIRCHVPPLLEVLKYSEMEVHKITRNGSHQVPITLIRKDGVVYPTGIEFQYSTFSAGEIGKIVYKNPLNVDDNNAEEENQLQLLEETLSLDEEEEFF
uniref:Uncharacterized protein n=1 Tax=Panagrolaimus superbus TaxID=310955 RepID=A0A914Z839_9BILA